MPAAARRGAPRFTARAPRPRPGMFLPHCLRAGGLQYVYERTSHCSRRICCGFSRSHPTTSPHDFSGHARHTWYIGASLASVPFPKRPRLLRLGAHCSARRRRCDPPLTTLPRCHAIRVWPLTEPNIHAKLFTFRPSFSDSNQAFHIQAKLFTFKPSSSYPSLQIQARLCRFSVGLSRASVSLSRGSA